MQAVLSAQVASAPTWEEDEAVLIPKPLPLLTGCLEPECLISSLMGLSESEIREADKARALALHHAADTPCTVQ